MASGSSSGLNENLHTCRLIVRVQAENQKRQTELVILVTPFSIELKSDLTGPVKILIVGVKIVGVVKIHAARRGVVRVEFEDLVFENLFKLPLGKSSVQVEAMHKEDGREKEQTDGEHFCEKMTAQLLLLWRKISSTQGSNGRHRVSQALSPDSGCGVSGYMSHLSTQHTFEIFLHKSYITRSLRNPG